MVFLHFLTLLSSLLFFSISSLLASSCSSPPLICLGKRLQGRQTGVDSACYRHNRRTRAKELEGFNCKQQEKPEAAPTVGNFPVQKATPTAEACNSPAQRASCPRRPKRTIAENMGSGAVPHHLIYSDPSRRFSLGWRGHSNRVTAAAMPGPPRKPLRLNQDVHSIYEE